MVNVGSTQHRALGERRDSAQGCWCVCMVVLTYKEGEGLLELGDLLFGKGIGLE